MLRDIDIDMVYFIGLSRIHQLMVLTHFLFLFITPAVAAAENDLSSVSYVA